MEKWRAGETRSVVEPLLDAAGVGYLRFGAAYQHIYISGGHEWRGTHAGQCGHGAAVQARIQSHAQGGKRVRIERARPPLLVQSSRERAGH